MPGTRTRPLALQIIAHGCGAILTVMYLALFAPEIAGWLIGGDSFTVPGKEWEGVCILSMFILMIVGFGVSWWSRILAGAATLLGAAIGLVPFLALKREVQFFGLPLIAMGVFYILLHRAERSRAIVPERQRAGE